MTVPARRATGLASACLRGIGFLADRRRRDGLWEDFQTRAGLSVDWVSGFVVCCLADVAGAWEMCERARDALLRRQRPGGGWSYHERIPEDADSTAWVLRALVGAAQLSRPAVRAAVAALLAHQGPEGGLATYRRPELIGAVIGEADAEALRGWTGAHPCVSACGALALLEHGADPRSRSLDRLLDHVLAARGTDGLWGAYWWRGPTYATYLALGALQVGRRLAAAELRRALHAIVLLQQPDGGWGDGRGAAGGEPSHVFATALAVRTLAIAPGSLGHQELDRAVRWLLDRQDADGSWPSVPILRIPDSQVTDPDATGAAGGRPEGDLATSSSRPGTGIVVADHRRTFATAAAVAALETARRSAGLHAP